MKVFSQVRAPCIYRDKDLRENIQFFNHGGEEKKKTTTTEAAGGSTASAGAGDGERERGRRSVRQGRRRSQSGQEAGSCVDPCLVLMTIC